ncbi:hypothetical protein [uncultured Polaribacter sp.]|uniref:hypothetical protein n=1 Tax=uncultured Polaribacter sp. TaxID=174711 RepID=UPI002616F4C7|nr:hypothetical protein [uncultured Polaribacter sp.]
MKNLIFYVLLLFCGITNAQDNKINSNYVKDDVAKITSLKFSADKVEELKKINWDDIKSIFATNKPEQKIALGFALDLSKTSKDQFKCEITINDESKNIEDVIKKSKKMVKMMIKLSENK